jgi:RNA polymerase sigma-70 factor (ECF subfamily)
MRMANDEARWVAEARAGDAGAFRRLVEAHASALFRVCARITRDNALAEDAVQEALFNAYRHLREFDGRSAFSTWLHRIAVNAVLAARRGPLGRNETSLTGEDGEDMELAAEAAMDEATPIDLERAIGTLPAGARDIVVLHGIYGYSHEEAAGMLGVAVGTCKAQLHRARQLLRKRMPMEAAT